MNQKKAQESIRIKNESEIERNAMYSRVYKEIISKASKD